MFDVGLFDSWLSILTGAVCFALLFTMVGVMSDLLFDGVMRLSSLTLGLTALAFVGYLAIALLIRDDAKSR